MVRIVATDRVKIFDNAKAGKGFAPPATAHIDLATEAGGMLGEWAIAQAAYVAAAAAMPNGAIVQRQYLGKAHFFELLLNPTTDPATDVYNAAGIGTDWKWLTSPVAAAPVITEQVAIAAQTVFTVAGGTGTTIKVYRDGVLLAAADYGTTPTQVTTVVPSIAGMVYTFEVWA